MVLGVVRSGILGKEGGLPAKGLGGKGPASNAVIDPTNG